MWFYAYSLIEGALASEEYLDADADALEKWIDAEAAALAALGGEWSIHVVEHYCSAADEYCECAQYATDHRPLRSGSAAAALRAAA
ncbi:MAG: hypothetical protein KatS3mg015_2502 [Fimbriimonadales bacterium]|nr:MAG: hypothetical protein KatS3mg015_2502 [Fimbriimonadales bacterium]